MRIVSFLATLLVALAPAFAAAPAGWSTYTGRGFSIAYPPGWKVNPAYVEKGYRFFQGDAEDFREGVAFTPGVDLAPGTTLQSNQLSLVVERARPGDLCVAAAFLVDPSPDFPTQRMVDKPEAVQTIAEPGDLYTVEHIVVMASRTPCLAVHFTIIYARIKRGDAAKPFDHDALLRYLNSIASTLTVP